MINFIEFFLAALKGTPWWVYAIFVYIVILGISTLKTHTISLYKLLVFTLLFLGLSIYGLMSKAQGLLDVTLWSGAFCSGLIVSYFLFKDIKTTFDKEKFQLTIQGNSSLLILLLLIFFTKYFFGYSYATNIFAEHLQTLTTTDIASSGLIIGIFVGRSLVYYYNANKKS